MTTVAAAPSRPDHAEGPPLARLDAVDLLRGLSIIAVVAHHATGMALHNVSGEGALHDLLGLVNRALQFVVPSFLFVTALLLTRSARSGFEWQRHYGTRLRTVLLPYAAWTVLYVVFRVLTGQEAALSLSQPERWTLWLQYGKGYFHLYFLLILLQLYLILPLLLPLWRRTLPLPLVLGGALALQLAVFELNRETLNFRFPGTMLLWYVPAVLLGMYVGAYGPQFAVLWQRWRPAFVLLAAGAAVWYLPMAARALDGAFVSNRLYSAANWCYTTFVILALFGLLQGTRPPAPLRRLLELAGQTSLQIYLLHPALLYLLVRWGGLPGNPLLFCLVLALYAAASLALPVGVARLLAGRRVSVWLFGR